MVTTNGILLFFHTAFNHSLPCVPFLNKKLGVVNCIALGVVLESVKPSDSIFHIMSYHMTHMNKYCQRHNGPESWVQLRKGSNNQNGNSRCFFPWRGGGLEFHIPILKMIFLKIIWNHSLTVKTCFALSLGFILCIYSSWDDFEHG